MGITFHYSGRFNPAASLSAMINEVEDIAKSNHWSYVVYEKAFPARGFDTVHNHTLYGISFTPPECETVHLIFLSDGKMSSYFNLKLYGNPEKPQFPEFLYMLSVKTQYAGPQVHIKLLKLFKYINQKYLADFELHDEGKYWETEDETMLNSIFKRSEALIASFKIGLKTLPIQIGESLDAYIMRVAEHVQANDGGMKDGEEN